MRILSGSVLNRGEKMSREASLNRTTKETDITLCLELDGRGESQINTGIGFFDHMLDQVLAEAKKALGDKKGVKRFGSCILPMDETLVLCAIDLSGRPYLSFEGEFTTEKVGYMDTEMVKEFFYAISYSAGMNLHIKMSGSNNHHKIEAVFKAFGRALDEAVSLEPRLNGILSTKGSL